MSERTVPLSPSEKVTDREAVGANRCGFPRNKEAVGEKRCDLFACQYLKVMLEHSSLQLSRVLGPSDAPSKNEDAAKSLKSILTAKTDRSSNGSEMPLSVSPMGKGRSLAPSKKEASRSSSAVRLQVVKAYRKNTECAKRIEMAPICEKGSEGQLSSGKKIATRLQEKPRVGFHSQLSAPNNIKPIQQSTRSIRPSTKSCQVTTKCALDGVPDETDVGIAYLRSNFMARTMATGNRDYEIIKMQFEANENNVNSRLDLSLFGVEKSFSQNNNSSRFVEVKHFFQSPAVVFAIVWMVWVAAAVLFYMQHNGWAFTASFYYAIQAGMAVGFGAIIEPNDGSRLYTIVHVLIGSSFIVYVLSLIMKKLISNSKSWHEDLLEEADRANEAAEKLGKLKRKENKTCHLPRVVLNLVAVSVLFILIVFSGVAYAMEVEKFQFVKALYFSIGALSTAGLQPPVINPNKEDPIVFGLTLWMIFGIPFYGYILFAVAAGLTRSNSRSETKEKIRKAARPEKFQAAAAIANRFRKRDSKIIMENLPTDEEIKMITSENLRNKLRKLKEATVMNDSEVDWAGFLQMSLMRLGKIEASFLLDTRKHFERMDFDGSGKLDQFEMWVGLKFQQFDVDNSGTLDISEFVAFANSLEFLSTAAKKGKNVALLLRKAFLRVNTSQTGEITQKEFVLWIRKQWLRHGGSLTEKASNPKFMTMGMFERSAHMNFEKDSSCVSTDEQISPIRHVTNIQEHCPGSRFEKKLPQLKGKFNPRFNGCEDRRNRG
eukprot:jgi/Bigna1/88145/estExt_fgenesh1_pg.C_280171